MNWRYVDAIEVRKIKLAGETVSLAQWRQDADRSSGFSEKPEFLFAMDRGFSDQPDQFFRNTATLYYGPYPRATAVSCDFFAPVSALVESLGFPFLILYPQNLVNWDRGKSLIDLLQRLPNLQVHIHTGSRETVEMFAGKPESSRIEYQPVPVHPRDFHANLARMYGFELPKWFLEPANEGNAKAPDEARSIWERLYSLLKWS